MKKIALGISTLAISTLMLGVSSCKKTDNKNNVVCKITSAVATPTGGTPSSINFTYDNGKLSSVITTGSSASSKNFSYSGNTINIIEKDGSGAIDNTKEITLNSNNKIGTITEKDPSGTIQNIMTCYYDANGDLQRTISIYSGGTPDTTDFIFSGGNLFSVKSPGSTSMTTLSYFTDKTWQEGDYIKLIQFVDYGAFYIQNKNLVKSLSFGSSTQDFSYEYNSAGRITKLTMTSGGIVSNTVTYSYDCP